MFKTIGIVAAIVLIGAGTYLINNKQTPPVPATALVEDSVGFGSGHSVTMYKDPNCGCCAGHAAALSDAGFEVTIKETRDMATIKEEYHIPIEGESCHTSVIDDYVVEGHVPLEAIEKLLNEQPDIYGIGLASMPIGTPGMPGKKTAPYKVYQLSETGELSPYLSI